MMILHHAVYSLTNFLLLGIFAEGHQLELDFIDGHESNTHSRAKSTNTGEHYHKIF